MHCLMASSYGFSRKFSVFSTTKLMHDICCERGNHNTVLEPYYEWHYTQTTCPLPQFLEGVDSFGCHFSFPETYHNDTYQQ